MLTLKKQTSKSIRAHGVGVKIGFYLQKIKFLEVSFLVKQFEWVKTGDGSPTLKPRAVGSEWMHSKAGAWSETEYVYGHLLDKALPSSTRSMRILVMGLGLGYIELLALKKSLSINIPIEITSFEVESDLMDFFINKTLHGQGDLAEYLIAKDSNVDWSSVFRHGLELHKSSKLIFKSNILTEVSDKDQCQVLAYDAYSSGAQAELWTEDFLIHLLKTIMDPDRFYLSTYAASSNLKRAAQALGLKLVRRAGFAHKRESFYFEKI